MTREAAERTSEGRKEGRVTSPQVPTCRRLLRKLKKLILSRFNVMMVIPACVLLFIWIHEIEPNRLMLRHEVIPASSLTQQTFRKPLRIMHLSDLMLGSEKSVRRLQFAVEMIVKNQPDLVLLTGNYGFPKDSKQLTATEACLAYLRAIVPTFACLGNEDVEQKGTTVRPKIAILNMLQSSGIQVLRNERKRLIVNGIALNIIGLADSMSHPYNVNQCLLTNADQNEVQPLTLLLCHTPDVLPKIQAEKWDVLFSGHSLGGQFRFPFTRWCPFSPVKLKQFAAKDLYELDDNRFLSVTAGIGNRHEMRLNCFPEIVLVEILPDKNTVSNSANQQNLK